jgi:hypothetical protein
MFFLLCGSIEFLDHASAKRVAETNKLTIVWDLKAAAESASGTSTHTCELALASSRRTREKALAGPASGSTTATVDLKDVHRGIDRVFPKVLKGGSTLDWLNGLRHGPGLSELTVEHPEIASVCEPVLLYRGRGAGPWDVVEWARRLPVDSLRVSLRCSQADAQVTVVYHPPVLEGYPPFGAEDSLKDDISFEDLAVFSRLVPTLQSVGWVMGSTRTSTSDKNVLRRVFKALRCSLEHALHFCMLAKTRTRARDGTSAIGSMFYNRHFPSSKDGVRASVAIMFCPKMEVGAEFQVTHPDGDGKKLFTKQHLRSLLAHTAGIESRKDNNLVRQFMDAMDTIDRLGHLGVAVVIVAGPHYNGTDPEWHLTVSLGGRPKFHINLIKCDAYGSTDRKVWYQVCLALTNCFGLFLWLRVQSVVSSLSLFLPLLR